MSLGKVHVWKMTEKERLAYIEKHPIIPTERPSGGTFSNINTMAVAPEKKGKKGPKIIDSVDKDELHRLYLDGITFPKMAKALNISEANIGNYIKQQRKSNPEKWPYRIKMKKG